MLDRVIDIERQEEETGGNKSWKNCRLTIVDENWQPHSELEKTLPRNITRTSCVTISETI